MSEHGEATMSNVFDRKVDGASGETPAVMDADAVGNPNDSGLNAAPEGHYTLASIKDAVQELLKLGVLEAERKPNLYQTALVQRAAIDQILEPLDLRLQLDEIRGLAFVAIATAFHEGEDDWNHPLVRRQRLTLEQSLLVAMLRQLYVTHEQEQGIGAAAVVVHLDDLLPQVQLYLGDTGSDAREQKRLRSLLEQLRAHGIVSDVDERESFTIRPLITHLANPQSLQTLLQHLRRLTAGTSGDERDAAEGPEAEDQA